VPGRPGEHVSTPGVILKFCAPDIYVQISAQCRIVCKCHVTRWRTLHSVLHHTTHHATCMSICLQQAAACRRAVVGCRQPSHAMPKQAEPCGTLPVLLWSPCHRCRLPTACALPPCPHCMCDARKVGIWTSILHAGSRRQMCVNRMTDSMSHQYSRACNAIVTRLVAEGCAQA
jgi:hypothetical protein